MVTTLRSTDDMAVAPKSISMTIPSIVDVSMSAAIVQITAARATTSPSMRRRPRWRRNLPGQVSANVAKTKVIAPSLPAFHP
jgi:hypothetical protein